MYSRFKDNNFKFKAKNNSMNSTRPKSKKPESSPEIQYYLVERPGRHGDKGDKGDLGNKGDTGDKGDKGDAITHHSRCLTYNLSYTQIVTMSTLPYFVNILYFPWCYHKYSSFTKGTVIFKSVITDTGIIIRMIDDDNDIVAGPACIKKTGIHTLDFETPKKNTGLVIQISKHTDEGESPSIFGINLEFN